MRNFLFAFFLLLTSPLLSHIGSVNTTYEGRAGPYALRVIIQPSSIIPGFAPIHVKVLNANGSPITEVSVKAVRFNVPESHETYREFLELQSVEPPLYRGQLQIMVVGPYRIFVKVKGARGEGSLIIPFDAKVVESPEMVRWKKMLFTTLYTLMSIAFLILIVKIFNGRRGALITGLFFISLILGITYILHVKNIKLFNQKKYESLRFSIKSKNDKDALLVIDDPRWTNSYRQDPLKDGFLPLEGYWGSHLIPDHGKWMHLFLISEDRKSFAHLHPQKIDARSFVFALPPLPAGKYALYADIVHENGFAQTLTGTISLLQIQVVSPPSDPDDTWYTEEKSSSESTYEIILDKQNLADGLQFSIRSKNGDGVRIDPYMGMLGHAVLLGLDKPFFIHLHPSGTVPAAAEQLYGVHKMADALINSQEVKVNFPFVFSEAGKYKLWVQMKINNQIVTRSYILDIP